MMKLRLRDTLTCLRTHSKSVCPLNMGLSWDLNPCLCDPKAHSMSFVSQVAQYRGCPEEGEAASAWRSVSGMTFLRKWLLSWVLRDE